MKLNKEKLNKAWKVTAWTCLITGMIISLAFVSREQSRVICQEVNISLKPDTMEGFIDKDEVIKTITNGKGLSALLNMPFDTDSVPAMEKKLNKNPYLKNADVFLNVSGELNVSIRQRRPLVRIIRFDGNGYYIDEDGMKMPLSPTYTARVMVATGNLYERYQANDSVHSYVAKELYTLARYVDKNPFWKAQIEQIFVNASSELILIPKVGGHVILLGTTEDLEDKLQRLLVFYKKAMPRAGWNTYKTINLKFKDQVVCEKN